jgi:hypothetical protein
MATPAKAEGAMPAISFSCSSPEAEVLSILESEVPILKGALRIVRSSRPAINQFRHGELPHPLTVFSDILARPDAAGAIALHRNLAAAALPALAIGIS